MMFMVTYKTRILSFDFETSAISVNYQRTISIKFKHLDIGKLKLFFLISNMNPLMDHPNPMKHNKSKSSFTSVPCKNTVMLTLTKKVVIYNKLGHNPVSIKLSI